MFRALSVRLLLIAVTILMPLVTSLTLATPAGADVVCADLIVTGIVVTPSSPIQDQNTDIAVTVKNQGSCDSVGFVTQLKASGTTQVVLSDSLASLAMNTSYTFHWTYAFPNDGSFMLTATADSGNAVPETIETNNIAILSVTVQPKTIDLMPTSITFVPDPAVATDAMQAIVHVINLGNTDATDFQVQWKPTPTGPVQTQLVNGLAANGGATDITFDYVYPYAGTFNTTVTVDSAHDIKESNETNNSISRSLTVDPPLPDLVVDSVTVNPPNPIAGQPMQLTATIKNVGHRPAGDFEVDWTPVFGQKLQQQVLGPLDEGNSVNVTFDYTFDRGGSFNTTVSADSTNKVREVNEQNNTSQVQITVDKAAVDLTITDFEVSPTSPIQGADTTFTVKVKNLGNTAAGSFVVAVNPDSTGISSNGKQTLSKQVDSLDPGVETTLTFHFQYPEPGNYRAIAQADALKNVAESNEANNTALLNMVVKPGDIDLQVTAVNISTDLCAQAVGYGNACSPMLYWSGTAMTAAITVKNFGSYPAGAFSVEWLLHDTDSRGPTESLAGLLPGQSATVYIHGTYSKDGTFNTLAVVDPFDQVKEGCVGCEANNSSSLIPITIMPRDTTVNVTNPSFIVHNDLDNGIAGNGEWNMYFMVLDSSSTCHIKWQIAIINPSFDLKGFKCAKFDPSPDAPGDDQVGPGPTVTVTLGNTSPLVFSIIGYESDTFGTDNPGSASKFWLPGDYQVATNVVLNGQKGDSRCSNGDCFDATISVVVVTGPPPPAASSTSIGPNVQAHNALTQINSFRNMLDSMSGQNPSHE